MAKRPHETNSKIAIVSRRVTDAAMTLVEPLGTEPEFMHAVLCQVGLPRSEVKAREFTRTTGGASMLIEAGKWFDGFRYHDMPLPYGTRPRLVLFHICSEAIRRKSPEVEVERSASAFLERLGIAKGGESMAVFKRQMLALAACRMQIGYRTETKVVNVKCDPISRFDAWMQHDNGQLGLWPGSITLSSDFYETLREHAVPLDPRAIGALQNSALALDTYTWLAHRLCRVKQNKGVTLYWKNLKDQFGQEYRSDKDFKREFSGALRKAHAVYPDAKMEIVHGGLRLFPSPPPVKRRQVVVALPAPVADRQGTVKNSKSVVANAVPVLNSELVSAAALAELAVFAPDWNSTELLAMFTEFRTSKHAEQAKRDHYFLQWARAFTSRCPHGGIGSNAPASVAGPQSVLREETIEQARTIAPGNDVAELERRWRTWSAGTGGTVKSPDAAFLGWVKKATKSKQP